MGTQKRRRFDRQFKLEAVRLVTERGHSVAQVARDLGVRPDMLRRWQRQAAADPKESFPGLGRPKESDREVLELRRQLQRVSEERDILKKALAIFSGPRS
jgi:transposase